MKVDKIVKNAKVFTSNVKQPYASAFAVKDGRFVYVGDEAGLADFEGEVCDLGGKLVTPGLIDSHVHVTMSAANEYKAIGPRIECANKKECIAWLAKYAQENPGRKHYDFLLELANLEKWKERTDDSLSVVIIRMLYTERK